MNYLENLDTDDLEGLKYYMKTLFLRSSYEGEIYEEILEESIEYIEKNKPSKEITRIILESFDEDNDLDKVIIMLCRDFVCDPEFIKYVVNLFEDVGDVIYILGLLMTEKKQMNYGMVADNILYVYDYKLTNKDVQQLMGDLLKLERIPDNEDGKYMEDYLKSKITCDREDYEKPYWVSLIEGENVSLLTSVPLGESELTEEEVKFNESLQSVNNFFYSIVPEEKNTFLKDMSNEIEDALKTFLKASNETESEEFKIKLNNPERVWGPENKMKERDCCSGPNSEGPCRMLQCECLEENDEDSYDPQMGMTWFKGRCDACEKFIMDPSHALRFPNVEGGWMGCYCCFDCLKDDPMYDKSDKLDFVLNLMKIKIDHIGIMDRSTFY